MNSKYYLLLICFAWMSAVIFHDDLIPMTFNGEVLDKPFLGGFNRPKIQWVDWNSDGDLDLFILDAGYLRYLENQGTVSEPNFKMITPAFQNSFSQNCYQYTNEANCNLSGACYWIDDAQECIPQDGLFDCSSFMDQTQCEDAADPCLWDDSGFCYEDYELNGEAGWRGSWFHFAHFDDDEYIDLMTPNKDNPNHISYFKNFDGQLYFAEVLSDINGGYVTSSPYMTPTFADIDNNGTLDFFTGNMVGTLTYYENTGNSALSPQMEFITNSWQDIYIVSGARQDNRHGASAITFIDLDGNGTLDLSWGDYFQQSLYIIWNEGTADSAVMNEVTPQFPPNDPIYTAGQNMPTFADLDGNGVLDLYVTVLSGAYGNQLVDNFFYYENTGTNSDPEYNYNTNNYFSTLDIFSNSSPDLVDIDNDGDLDLFVANQYDLSSTPWVGRIHFFRNTGTNSPIYEEESISLFNEDMGQMLSPEFGDLNGDGRPDLVVGGFNGYIQYFENTGDGDNVTFSFVENVANIDLSGNSVPTLGDLDGDGDLDLLIGQLNGSLVFYRNIGDSLEYDFQEETFDNISVENNSAPELMDTDNDGDLDLVLGSAEEGLFFYQNLGNSNNYQFQIDICESVPSIGVNIKPTMGYLFNNGEIMDIITGLSTGGLYHLQTEICSAPLGDLDYNGGFNILDIITLINCILDQNCSVLNGPDTWGCAGNMNGDCSYSILDILILIDCVLEETCG